MSSLEIQRLKPSLLSLPDDFLWSCFARVSRLYYPTLSLVSKHFRSLLASPELYKVRSSLRNTENCLYVCLKFFLKDHWFTLCRKPDQFITNEKSRGYVLARLPTLISTPTTSLCLVAVGSDIYSIVGSSPLWPTSRVSVLDCTSHTWREAPSLRAKLAFICASNVSQKIYLGGSYKYDINSLSWKKVVEVLDTKTQIWDTLPIPTNKIGNWFIGSACIDGKFHLNDDKEVFAYNSEEGRWDSVGPEMGLYMSHKSYCEIENVLYSSIGRELQWYDTQLRMWKEVKGLLGLPNFANYGSLDLVDYGGKMVIFWTKVFHNKTRIWCAEITLEKRSNCEMWGKVEWCDHVLTIPSCMVKVVKVLAATV